MEAGRAWSNSDTNFTVSLIAVTCTEMQIFPYVLQRWNSDVWFATLRSEMPSGRI